MRISDLPRKKKKQFKKKALRKNSVIVGPMSNMASRVWLGVESTKMFLEAVAANTSAKVELLDLNEPVESRRVIL